jgi:hypothetical protein
VRETRKEGGRERKISLILLLHSTSYSHINILITYLTTEDEQDCDILYCEDTEGERLGSGTEAGHAWVYLLGVDHGAS